jgi:lycopene cyclase domain-containing protein
MTYFGVLAVFLIPPLILVAVLAFLRGDLRRDEVLAVFAHVLIAVIYTTPWDNYLVATGVWWYEPSLVSGLRIGWVPIEEYTFFILQTLLTGFWWLRVVKALPDREAAGTEIATRIRLFLSLGIGMVWLIAILGWVAGPQSYTYLTLILSWALLPVLIQVAFGGDVLFRDWRRLMVGVLPPTLYLWLADAIAIRSGTWTISPQQTTGMMLANLPLEEMVFFFMTNLLIVNGLILIFSPLIRERVKVGWSRLLLRLAD